MTGQTRRKPSVPAPAPQRTAATHASAAHEFFYRSALLLSPSQAKRHDWTTEQVFAETKRMGFDPKTSAEFSTFVAKMIG
ncbi:MAG: hypothetical protein WAO95_01535 [Burkholderiales bacterium]